MSFLSPSSYFSGIREQLIVKNKEKKKTSQPWKLTLFCNRSALLRPPPPAYYIDEYRPTHDANTNVKEQNVLIYSWLNKK